MKNKSGVRFFIILLIFGLVAVNLMWNTGKFNSLTVPGEASGNAAVKKKLTRDMPDRSFILSEIASSYGEISAPQSTAAFELGVCSRDVFCRNKCVITPICGSAVEWASSDTSVADVSSAGVVTTYKAGTAVISAKDAEGRTDECTINVLKVAYLTIDDTPTQFTPKLLDTLDKYDVKATFFMNAAPKQKAQYQEIYKRGHTFALHGYSHHTSYRNGEAFLENIEKCRQFIIETTGCKYVDNIFRFPTGSKGQKKYDEILDYMHQKNYLAFDWTTEFHDYYYHSANGCFNYFQKYFDYNYVNPSMDYAVVLFHPREWSVEALPRVIEYIKEKGYTFATVTEDTAEYNFRAEYLND